MFGNKEATEADLNRHFSRFADELWDDDEIKEKCVEVKRLSSKDFSKHSWKIFEDSELVVLLESCSLTKKQIKFLLTVDGIKFLIETYKKGNCNITKIKKAMCENVNNQNRK